MSGSGEDAGPSEDLPVRERDKSTNPEIEDRYAALKQRRKVIRSRITRSSNRIRDAIQRDENPRRLQRELDGIKGDFTTVRDIHSELYNYSTETSKLDQWEDELTSSIFDIEEELDNYMAGYGIVSRDNQDDQHRVSPSTISPMEQHSNIELIPEILVSNQPTQPSEQVNIESDVPENQHRLSTPPPDRSPTWSASALEDNPLNDDSTPAIDEWIDKLVEFKETVLPRSTCDMSVAEALFKLESSRDIPTIELIKFDGSPLKYCDFMERFKLQIHDKPHLTDNLRMIQLRMHLIGDAARVIGGMGSQGIMYPTAVKTLKQEFGQRSTIARAHINKITKGGKISNDRNSLRDFSLDIVNCIATLKMISYTSDVNAKETLRTIIRRLPDHMITKWQNMVTDIREKGQEPTIINISNFVRKRVKTMFDPDYGDLSRPDVKKYTGSKPVHSTHRQFTINCPVCNGDHKVPECKRFKELNIEERTEMAKNNRLCFSCLTRNHIARFCRSKRKCEINGCTRTHHQLFHYDPPSASCMSVLDKASLMPVVRASFRSANGRILYGNVLIDNAAGTVIIRRDFSKMLGNQGSSERLDLAVVGGQRIEQKNSRRVKIWLSDISLAEEFEIEAYEMGKTVIDAPSLDKKWLKTFKHLEDVEFTQTEGPIDLILGVPYSHLHAELEIRQGQEFEPVAKRTRLGWYVIGPNNSYSPVFMVNFVEKIDLSKFYEFETLGIQAPDCSCSNNGVISLDNKKALQLMESTCKREDNRYTIALPWKRDPEFLPNNYYLAEKRLLSLERSLSKTPKKAELYNKVIEEYEDNGWSKRMTAEEIKDEEKPAYYLPHHGVYRPDKVSTPLRVVFDPACQYRGVSLNSFLHKGPCLIGNLLGVLLRFREEPVAFTGDISKMFLQVRLAEEDTFVHRFLWRNLDRSRAPTIYRLMRITFGDKPSPDMASFVMLKIANEVEKSSTEVAEIIRRDRYMDDLIHSCSNPEEAIKRVKELETALEMGSFKIKEWFTSSETVRENLKESTSEKIEKGKDTTVSLDGEGETKTLGIGWNCHADILKFSVKSLEIETFTKRTVLSKLSMLYDPIGLASAVTIRARIEMQNLWRSKKYDWDDLLSPEICIIWRDVFAELENLGEIKFPRCIRPIDAIGLPELHVFADASSLAYGAVAYLLWNTSHGNKCFLVSSKARVAPLKQNTIPRLELMALLVSSRLAKTITEESKIKPLLTVLWSDSKVALQWIRSDSVLLKPFVGVRVSEIQSTWSSDQFRHVPSNLNPADDLSRSLTVQQMNGRWINGPDFLKKPKEEWPQEEVETIDSIDDPERKKISSLYSIMKIQKVIDPCIFSNYQRLLRVTAYCLRFIDRLCKRHSSDGDSVILSPSELERSEKLWIESAQSEVPDWEYRYRDLTPFKQDGIIRVGGRLSRSTLPYDQVHPVLLSPDNSISKLICRDIHNQIGHPGTERTLCEIRRKYWIVRGRNLTKGVVRNCVVCRRLRHPLHQTLMADLPPERLKTFLPPFTVTGIDLFGPFSLKLTRNKTTKAWGVLYTCATVRAIHLDIVESLSTESFLHTLRRFTSFHGWPTTIITDNGSNFVGAEKELRKLVQDGKKTLEEFAMLHKVKWLFITPLSPHQGGMYESLIKQTKTALRVAIGQQILTWNEMSTVFAEVKCLVNSRPLGYASNDPNDLQPLTPNHFLLGRASTDIPQGPYEETKNLHKRYLFVQMLVHAFWKRFVSEYIPTLIRRSKWQQKERQMQVNDIVLLSDHNLPRGKWELGKIIEVYPGKDNIVRNVLVETKSNKFKRSVQKLCPILESN